MILLVKDFAILLLIAVAVTYMFGKIGLPSLVGFILTGILIGPGVLGLMPMDDVMGAIGMTGLVMLLFTVGMEFSLGDLLRLRKQVLLGGIMQMGITALLFLPFVMGGGISKAVFTGFVIALSSSAIVLKLLSERGEIDSVHGRTSLAILIFQDLAVVPLIMIAPLIAKVSGHGEHAGISTLLLGIVAVTVIIVAGRLLLPPLLDMVAKSRMKELFILIVLAICLLIGWLTASLGLSIALGAFLAGLIISESDLSLRALTGMLPLRDLFTSIFFITLGMSFNTELLLARPFAVLLSALTVIILKIIVVFYVCRKLGLRRRASFITGLCLAQIGEFAFAVVVTEAGSGALSSNAKDLVIPVVTITMMVTPILIQFAPKIADLAAHLVPLRYKDDFLPLPDSPGTEHASLENHLVIIGYGVNGRMLAHAAEECGIEYVGIEMNPETVRAERKQGVKMILGDATQEAVLEHSGIASARAVVVATSDSAAGRRMVHIIRRLNPTVDIISRTDYVADIEKLKQLGATTVVAKEYEAALSITGMVLRRFIKDEDEAIRAIKRAREREYYDARKKHKS